MITEPATLQGFSPAPDHGVLLTGLLDLVAAGAVPAERLASIGATRLATLIGDACLVSVVAGRSLKPLAVSDPDPEGATLLAPLVGARLRRGHHPELAAYSERYGVAGELAAPMRARGHVVGELVVLRRGRSRPFDPDERRLVQAVADTLALGLGDTPLPAATPDVPAPDKLSRREREILALLALGHTNREIAEQIHLSVRTVEWHRARIQAKLRVTGRAALAQVARTHGLLGGTEREREE